MTQTAGAVFLVLGLASGLALTLAPFGIGAGQPQLVAWVLFPLLTIGGYILLAVAARGPAIALISRSAGGALLALAVAATVGLFVVGNSLVAPNTGTISLWYVLLIGLVLGTAGLSFRRSGDEGR
ncbi:MAG TPA: LPXTG cell wall anchor domain-containing protein [Burkholderiales bacterium]|nr:LPXTG cell wall anchor domain-containing protein [Burkholderiales bacterium]